MVTVKHLKPWVALVGKLIYIVASGLGQLIGQLIVYGFGVVLLSLSVFVLFWIGGVLFGQHFEAKSTDGHTSQTIANHASNLFVTNEIRLERRFGNNLRIYVNKTSFEEIYYPDRQLVVEDFGVYWCDSVDKTYLPSVYFIDIHTGAKLTSYSCFWRFWHQSNKRK